MVPGSSSLTRLHLQLETDGSYIISVGTDGSVAISAPTQVTSPILFRWIRGLAFLDIDQVQSDMLLTLRA